MKNIITVFALVLSMVSANAQQLTKTWEASGLEGPESAVKYNDHYFVSNVNGQPAEKNGLGYITKLDNEGKIVSQKWATGFNAPKGLAIYGSKLYVADIDVVYVVDLNSGKIIKKYAAEGATFLNDVVISSKGTVYISDTFGGNAIYKIENESISLWLKDEALNYPNGLLIKGNQLFVASWGVVTDPATFGTDVPGKLLSVSLKNKEIEDVTSATGNLDGLVQLKGGNYLVSDWIAGGLMTITKKGEVKELLNLKPGSADLTLVAKENILLVPQMLDGTLVAYKLEY